MASGKQILDELTFKKMWASMPESEKLPYVAFQAYRAAVYVDAHETRIRAVEDGSKRQSSIMGGISGTITAVIIGLINYFFINKRS